MYNCERFHRQQILDRTTTQISLTETLCCHGILKVLPFTLWKIVFVNYLGKCSYLL